MQVEYSHQNDLSWLDAVFDRLGAGNCFRKIQRIYRDFNPGETGAKPVHPISVDAGQLNKN